MTASERVRESEQVSVERATGGGGRLQAAAGVQTKNKNPTQRCGEQYSYL